MKAPTWHASKTGDHQGLVIDDETGRNVAVTYDKADAPLVAEAPAMLDELYRLLPFIEDAEKDPAYKPGIVRERTRAILDIIRRIEDAA